MAEQQQVKVAASATAVPVPSRSSKLPTFDAFRSRPFRLLWLHTLSAFLVQGIQRFAFVWLVLDLTDDRGAAGIVVFALGIPAFFLSLPAGVLSDNTDRRALLFGSQLVAAAALAVGATLIWSDAVTLGLTFALASIVGATIAIGQPARTAILPSLVEREGLMNAIVLTTLGQNLTMIIGPALGGAAIALWGIGGAFALQAVLSVASLVVLLPLRIPPVVARGDGRRPLQELREGIDFVVRT